MTTESDTYMLVDVSIPSPSKEKDWMGGRNHEIHSQATAGQLQAATLPVRVIYQSSSTVPCCIRLASRSRDQPNSATMLTSK